MIKRESKFTILFRHWIRANPMHSAAFELKQTTGESIPFSDVQEHQLDALYTVKHGTHGLLYKAPDDSRGVKPFDLFFFRAMPAYVVIKYPGFFSIIDINEFILEKENSRRKSLTAERAKIIAWKTIEC